MPDENWVERGAKRRTLYYYADQIAESIMEFLPWMPRHEANQWALAFLRKLIKP